MAIELKSVSKCFLSLDKVRCIFSNVNFIINDDFCYAITGESGIGKTSLLHILGGLDVDFEGEVLVDGQPLINGGRKIFSYVFQDHNLFAELTVEENLLMPFWIKYGAKRSADLNSVNDILDKFSMKHLTHSLIKNLSGGEKQRVAILRAALGDCRFILADEPIASLDKENSDLVIDLLLKIHKEKKIGLIVSSHDEELVNKMDIQINLSRNGVELHKRN